jgi:hypothetical protein
MDKLLASLFVRYPSLIPIANEMYEKKIMIPEVKIHIENISPNMSYNECFPFILAYFQAKKLNYLNSIERIVYIDSREIDKNQPDFKKIQSALFLNALANF